MKLVFRQLPNNNSVINLAAMFLKIGGAAKKRTTIEKALVAKIDYKNLILLVGEEEFRLKRYTGSGNRPRCSKNNPSPRLHLSEKYYLYG